MRSASVMDTTIIALFLDLAEEQHRLAITRFAVLQTTSEDDVQ